MIRSIADLQTLGEKVIEALERLGYVVLERGEYEDLKAAAKDEEE